MTVVEELKQVKELIYQGHYQEALHELGKLESRELADDDRLTYQLQKCSILTIKGDFENALDLANQVFQDSKICEKPMHMIDALISKGNNLIWLGRLTDASIVLEKVDHILKQDDSIHPSAVKEKQQLLNCSNGSIQFKRGDLFNALEKLLKGLVLSKGLITKYENIILRNFWVLTITYSHLGQFDLGLKYAKKGLAKSEEIGYTQGIGWCLGAIGVNSLLKGELNQATEYSQKTLPIHEKLGNKIDLAFSLGILGGVYQAKGETDEALKYLQQCLAIYEELGIDDDVSATFNVYLSWTYKAMEKYPAAINAYEKSISIYYSLNTKHWMVHFPLFGITRIYIEINNHERAEHYIQQLQQLYETTGHPLVGQTYRLTQALFLKASIRMRDKMKALEIFKQIAEEDLLYYHWTITAIIAICELLVEELQYTGEEEVFKEVKSWINKLSEIAKAQHAYYYLVQIYLIQAKFSLLKLDLNQSRQLLAQAQLLADEKGLKQLMMIITIEQESLEAQWSKWEQIIKQKPPMNEVIKLTQLGDLLDRIINDRMYRKEEEIREYATRAQQFVEKWERKP